MYHLRLLLLSALVFVLATQAPAQQLTTDPDQALFVTADIDRFWAVFDAATGDIPTAKALRSGYLQPGSQGLRDFIKNRIQNHKALAATLREQRDYYLAVRPYTLRIKELEAETRRHYRAFKALYPPTVYPEAYFVIGRMNSGGTTGPRSLIMGAEMFGDTAGTPAARIAFDGLPTTVIHELVHYQQRYSGPEGLLKQVIKEGAADFVAAVVMGADHTVHYLDDFARPRSREIWQKFLEEKDNTGWKSYRGWMYSDASRLFPAAPNDLGYWLGFQICRAYYERAGDQRQAIADILNIDDPEAFLAASGYVGEQR